MFDKANKDTSLLSALSATDADQTALVNDLYQATQQFVNDVLWTSGGTVADLVGLRRGQRRAQAGVLVRLVEHLPDVEPVDDEVGQVGLRRGQRQQAIDLSVQPRAGGQAAVGGRGGEG